VFLAVLASSFFGTQQLLVFWIAPYEDAGAGSARAETAKRDLENAWMIYPNGYSNLARYLFLVSAGFLEDASEPAVATNSVRKA
jgi:hypothetical protein